VSLELIFKDALVVVPFSPQLTFIHGQVGTGKSSIARLVDWCLGDDMDLTPALEDELISAGLVLEVGEHRTLVVRDREDKSHVRLSWAREDEDPHNEIVPLQSSGGDWDPTEPETLGDYLFVLAGVTPLRVPKSRQSEDTTLQRLSFRDFLAFCYLPQENLNVALMRFGEPFKGRKSEDVMRAILGLYSERQQQLQAGSEALLRNSNQLRTQAEEVTAFLDRLEIDGLSDIEAQLAGARQELARAEQARAAAARDQLPATHPSDALRRQLRSLEAEIERRRDAVGDIDERLERDQRLRAELITAQLKLDRSMVSVEVLSGVQYGHCPQCGSTLGPSTDPAACRLCRSALAENASPLPPEASQSDLQSRIDELAESLDRHRVARAREARHLREREARKAGQDTALAAMLRDYESKRLASAREAERRLAVARGAVERFTTANRLRSEVKRLREESGRLLVERAPIIDELKTENAKLAEQERYRDEIAKAFHEALLAVGMPDITPQDTVVITDKLQPRVEPASGRSPYGFKNVGSSGMKTLFQCCYALALHRVAAEHDLLLPRFLIIDTPTQNVDERVDSEIFHSFFRYLYELLQGSMASAQVVLIDSELEAPPEGIEMVDRLMLRHDPAHPRLVPYYLPTTQADDTSKADEGTSSDDGEG
jgi:hypothetical protein